MKNRVYNFENSNEFSKWRQTVHCTIRVKHFLKEEESRLTEELVYRIKRLKEAMESFKRDNADDSDLDMRAQKDAWDNFHNPFFN